MARSTSPRGQLQRTPLHEAHLSAGARMVPFAGYEMPVQYSSVVEEHHAVRKAVGLFDVSHMGEISFRGKDALALLQALTPNDVSLLTVGRAHYNAILTEQGTFIDDVLVYCRGPENYLVVVNAAGLDDDLRQIRELLGSYSDVDVEDQSKELALLALQGPRAEAMLRPMSSIDVVGLGYYRFSEGTIAGIEAMISRTGYTGEDGFELYCRPADALDLWDRLVSAGAEHQLCPAGLGARDTLRLEAGMLLSGQDIDREVTPIEAGLAWMVKPEKGDFVGRSALLLQLEGRLRQRVVGFELLERGIARSGHAVFLEEAKDADSQAEPHGTVSSGTWSPTLSKAIGLARLAVPETRGLEIGCRLEIEIRSKKIPAQVVSPPFYRRPR